MRAVRSLPALAVIAACAVTAGCERLPGTKAYAVRTAEERVAKLLIDPASAMFTEVEAYGDQHERVCGLINGRNRMGGYAGPTRFISTPSDVRIAPDSSEVEPFELCEFEAAQAFYCSKELGPAIATAGC